MVRKENEFTMIKQRKDKNNTEGCWLVTTQLTPPHIGRTVYRHSYPRDSLNRGGQKERERRDRVGKYTSKVSCKQDHCPLNPKAQRSRD